MISTTQTDDDPGRRNTEYVYARGRGPQGVTGPSWGDGQSQLEGAEPPPLSPPPLPLLLLLSAPEPKPAADPTSSRVELEMGKGAGWDSSRAGNVPGADSAYRMGSHRDGSGAVAGRRGRAVST